MTEKNISEILKEHEKVEIYQGLIEALQKQIPARPIEVEQVISFMFSGKCRNCGKGVNSRLNYCSKCGQRIKW